MLCHWATTTGQPPAPTILYMYCTGATEILQSHTWQPLSMCHQNSTRGWPKILTIRREPMMSGFFGLNVYVQNTWDSTSGSNNNADRTAAQTNKHHSIWQKMSLRTRDICESMTTATVLHDLLEWFVMLRWLFRTMKVMLLHYTLHTHY